MIRLVSCVMIVGSFEDEPASPSGMWKLRKCEVSPAWKNKQQASESLKEKLTRNRAVFER